MHRNQGQQQTRPVTSSRTGPNTQSSSRQNNSNTAISNGHSTASIMTANAPRVASTTTATLSSALAPASNSSMMTQPQEAAREKARKNYQEQLLTEHFGFQPLSFVDDVINSVNNMIYQASMALQEFVEAQMVELAARQEANGRLDPNLDVKVESAKCMHKFETLLESSVDKNFDRFELYVLKNLFGVPEPVDVVLPHYEALDFEIGVEKEQKLDEELEILRRRVIATKALNYRLRKELAIEDSRRRQLVRCRDQIQFLRDAAKEHSDVVPVPQTLIFIRDNIETLHRRFQSLHERLSTQTRPSTMTTEALAFTGNNSASLPPPPDSVMMALHESLVGLEPDNRAVYIRSVVRRQIEDNLENDTE